MGKLKNLASVKTANRDSFVYTPPNAAFGALRTLVKVDSAHVSLEVLATVLRGVRRANPLGRIVIIDRVESDAVFDEVGITTLLDAEIRLSSVDNLLMETYRNQSPTPQHYVTMTAPGYLGEYDCVLNVSHFHQGENGIAASLANLTDVVIEARKIQDSGTSRLAVHQTRDVTMLPDVYFTIGQFIHGAVVEVGEADKIVWGDDMLAVDESACRVAGVAVPDYIETICNLKQMNK